MEGARRPGWGLIGISWWCRWYGTDVCRKLDGLFFFFAQWIFLKLLNTHTPRKHCILKLLNTHTINNNNNNNNNNKKMEKKKKWLIE